MEKPFEVAKRETVEAVSQVLQDSQLPPGVLVMILEKMVGVLMQEEKRILNRYDQENMQQIEGGDDFSESS